MRRYYCKEFEWTDWEASPKDVAMRVRFQKVQCTEGHKGARVDEAHKDCKKLNCAGIATKQTEMAKYAHARAAKPQLSPKASNPES